MRATAGRPALAEIRTTHFNCHLRGSIQHTVQVREIVGPEPEAGIWLYWFPNAQGLAERFPRDVVHDQHPGGAEAEWVVLRGVVIEEKCDPAELTCGPLGDRPKIDVPVRDVDRENAARLQMPQVDGEGFPRQQMHRNRVTGESINRQHVEVLVRLALE